MRDRDSRESSRKREEKYNINEQIRAVEVRLIGLDGGQVGVVKLADAMRMAEEAAVDLVEIAPDASPPVCRLLDYGKLKYREQKKAAEARKKSSVHTVKELRVRYSTDQHDLDTKIRNARKFIEHGDRVRFLMRFKGREAVYQALGRETLDQIVEALKDIAAVEEFSPLIGQRMVLALAPKGMAKAGSS